MGMLVCRASATTAPAAGRGNKGFSLLEAIMALSIVAIVAAYALPAYVRHTARGHRMAAVTALYKAAHFVEASSHDVTRGPHARLPPGLDQAPSLGMAVYRLRLIPGYLANGGYALEARPVEPGPMAADACGTFVLDATGRRWNRPSTARANVALEAHCWSMR
jgi:type IV pilus assembly protein PilE